ncbi:MAG: NFACT family protein [Clostridiales bacterium]|nr:NFACT family protein [Clostridiales bacterium]
MPLDGFAIAAVVCELREQLLGGRVDKINQPEADEFIFNIRAKGKNHRLIMTSNASQPRAHLTSIISENPFTPPMACMVMRKHLIGGRIVNITQPCFERIIEIWIESLDEMRDSTVKRVIIEMMGKHSNVILADGKGRVLEAAKHISYDKSAVRPILPGFTYSSPPGDKSDPLECSREQFFSLLSSGTTAQYAIYQNFNGISPAMAANICETAGIDSSLPTSTMSDTQRNALFNSFNNLFERARAGNFINRVIMGSDGAPQDFICVPMSRFASAPYEDYESVSVMIETFYSKRHKAYRINQKTSELRRLIKTNLERCAKKADKHAREMRDAEQRDQFRAMGDLITANMYDIKKGMTTFNASDYVNPGAIVEIELDAELSPAENAQRYFTKYVKAKRAHAALTEQIKQNEVDMDYLYSVQNALDNAESEAEIEEIRDELVESGYSRSKQHAKGKNAGRMARGSSKTKPLQYTSADGFVIIVGKNNRQNDEITLRLAEPNDLWLHTKGVPGSHVIIRADGRSVSDAAIDQAAGIAAYYSKARESSLVPVDYTLKRHVKKPNGAKPGMVIYVKNKTAYVNPRLPQ